MLRTCLAPMSSCSRSLAAFAGGASAAKQPRVGPPHDGHILTCYSQCTVCYVCSFQSRPKCSRTSTTTNTITNLSSSLKGRASSRPPEQGLCSCAASRSHLTGQRVNVGFKHCTALLQWSSKQQGGVLQLQDPSVNRLLHSSLQRQYAVSAACLLQPPQAHLQQLLPRWHCHTLWQGITSHPKLSLWQQQQQQWPGHMQHAHPNLQQPRQYHAQHPQQPNAHQPDTSNRGDSGTTSQERAAAAAEGLPGSAVTTLPNMLSLSRVALGPWLAYCIASQQWPVAVLLTAAAGATDWLDGYLARRLGHTSKLGSYLDPLCDKVFVATAVGTLGWMGMVPSWLAVLVVGRDSTQVVGMFWYRLRMFGGTWPGATAFFDVDHAIRANTPPSGSAASAADSFLGGGTTSVGTPYAGKQQQHQEQLPMLRPLFISKANTALVMALVAGCMINQWQGLPDQDVLGALEAITAGTTLASAGAYAHLYCKGQLLASAPAEQGRSSL